MKKYVLALMMFLIVPVANAIPDADVELLAKTRLADVPDSDVMSVFSCAGAKHEQVVNILLQVSYGPARIDKLVVEYGDGANDELDVRQTFAAGSTSRWIDLKGGARCIRNVKVKGEAIGAPGHRLSIVEIYGLVRD